MKDVSRDSTLTLEPPRVQLPKTETRLVGKHGEEKMPFPLVRNVIGEPRCPRCRQWSPKDALFCIYCGGKLSSSARLEAAKSLFEEGFIDPQQYIALTLTEHTKPGTPVMKRLN